MEEWKDVIDYEGLYQVSSKGNVRNVKTGKLIKIRDDGVALTKNREQFRHHIIDLLRSHFGVEPPKIESLPNEKWRDVVGYEGRYLVSSLGRLKSLPNKVRKTEMLVKSTKYVKSNHQLVGLTTTNKDGSWAQNTHYLHRLVLEAFIGPCPSGMEGCHNDGDPTNNKLENLRWDTHRANGVDMKRHGRNKGRKNGKAILDELSVTVIKIRLECGESDESIASDYDVSPYTIKNIRNGYSWVHV